jgi:hypothetical protein
LIVDSFVVALSVVNHMREAAEGSLEEPIGTWLGEDPENWSVLRPTPVDPRQERWGSGSEETLEWVRTLVAIAYETADPFGQRPTLL